MFRICKTVRFEAAHILRNKDTTDEENKKLFGKCSNFHGHSYKVEVFVKSPILNYGMVINFSELKDIMNVFIIEKYDHKTLNQVMDVLPTAENIAQEIYLNLRKELHKFGRPLDKVRVWETDTCWAEYYE